MAFFYKIRSTDNTLLKHDGGFARSRIPRGRKVADSQLFAA